MTASTAPATLKQAQDMGLTTDEFAAIEKILGRTPNFTEMCIYSVMWSEHCSYKNSIKWLKTLPKDGDQMLVKAGKGLRKAGKAGRSMERRKAGKAKQTLR